MQKENAKAAKVIVNPTSQKRGFSGVKAGPIKPGDRKPSTTMF